MGGGEGSRVVSSSSEAVDLCDEIEAHGEAGRVLVGFTSEAGHFFAIGLGADDSCAMSWESVDPPYFQSRGTFAADSLIDFAVLGSPDRVAGHGANPSIRRPRSPSRVHGD